MESTQIYKPSAIPKTASKDIFFSQKKIRFCNIEKHCSLEPEVQGTDSIQKSASIKHWFMKCQESGKLMTYIILFTTQTNCVRCSATKKETPSCLRSSVEKNNKCAQLWRKKSKKQLSGREEPPVITDKSIILFTSEQVTKLKPTTIPLLYFLNG